MGDRYARFLLEEILPEVAKEYNLSADPNDRPIGASSSGGICAFTVAWNRPDAFRRVLSFIGSYTNLRGGDVYANLIRKTEPKPLRVFLQDGRNDLNIYAGSWFLANQAISSALEFAGYDTRFVVGTEAHNMKQGSAIMPDALRWLWRDYPKPIAKSKGGGGERQFVTSILDPDSDWQLVSQGHKFPRGRPSIGTGTYSSPIFRTTAFIRSPWMARSLYSRKIVAARMERCLVLMGVCTRARTAVSALWRTRATERNRSSRRMSSRTIWQSPRAAKYISAIHPENACGSSMRKGTSAWL